MALYPYRMQLVVDPDNPRNVVAAGSVSIYDSEDTAHTTLLTLTDPSGVPISNPIVSNANGFTAPFVTTSPEVLWVSGPYVDYFQSYKGMRDEAVAAVAAAEAAAVSAGTEAAAVATAAIGDATADAEAAATASADSATSAASAATSAANAAALVAAPADSAVQTLINASGSATRAALKATVAGEVTDTASATRAALNATIAAGVAAPVSAAVAAATGAAEGPLGRIVKARTGPYRILLCGTSIATFDRSPIQTLMESLKTTYGDSGMYSVRAGLLGGSTDAPYLGWKKQRYAGVFYQRSRGEAGSTDLTFAMYGDRIEVEFSQEANSEAANVEIDGVVVGASPAAGAQAFSQRQVFTTTAGAHTVKIKAPVGAGFVYFERLASYNSTRTGVEIIDGTLGGSTLGMMVQDIGATGQMVATVPVVGDRGVEAWFDRTDIDAVFVQQHVNDAGSSPLGSYFSTVYQPTMEKVIAKTRARRIPLGLVVEMAGHYLMPNDGGSSGRHDQYEQIAAYLRSLKTQNNVTVVDHQGATAMPENIPAYAARYYSAVTNLNVAAGTYTGDFIHANEGPATQIGTDLIHRQYGLTPPKFGTASEVRFERMRRLPSTEGKDLRLTIAGTTKRYPQAAGRANLVTGPGESSLFQSGTVPFYRDPSPANLASSLQASIDAAGTSDQYGSYEDWSFKNLGLPGSVPWLTAGVKRLLTIRVSGSATLRAYGVAQFLSPEGAVIPRTDTVNDRTECRVTIVGSEPVVISAWVSGTAASGNGLAISGRVYEITLADTSLPVLSKDAATGAQGSTGATGPAGGILSQILSGSWSSPTVGGISTVNTLVAGDLLMNPFIPAKDASIDQIGASVTTAAAGSTIRLGLYSSDATGRPATLLAEASTALDASTTGWKKASFTSSVALTGGTLYWFALVAQGGAPAVRSINTFTPLAPTSDTDVTNLMGYRATGVTGALGAFSSWTTYATICPFVRVQVV